MRDTPQTAQRPKPPPPQEPNDDRGSALPLELGVPFKGFISSGDDPAVGDQDWFVVTIPGEAPSVLSASLVGPPDLDVVLEWMAATPRGKRDTALLQADVVRKGPGDELLANLRVTPGRVFLRVRSAWYRNKPRLGSDKPYTLAADILPWAETIEAEPNDVIADAVVGNFERPMRGTLGHIGDRDVWRIPVTPPPGTRLQLKVSGLTNVTMEASVYWFGQERDVIRVKSTKGEGFTLRNLNVPETAEPSIVVMLHALKGAAPRAAYDILLNPEPASEVTPEAEPNDTPQSANSIAVGDTLTGFFDRQRDVDHVSLKIDAPTAANIVLTPPMDTRGTLEVHRPDGTLALTRAGPTKGAAVSAFGFGFTPGTWSLRLKGSSPNTTQTYALVVNSTHSESSEREPNDDAEAASHTALIAKAPVTGWIHPAGDRDLWSLERSEARGPGIVTFQVDPPKGMRLDVTLHSMDGKEVTGRRGLTAGQPGTFTHFLAPGRYTVRVEGSTKKGYSDSPYTLRLLD
ncbi:MAG: hypothetical protein ACPGU1_04715 [Myxococcota bacterium]